MKIQSAEYVKSFVDVKKFDLQPLPTVAFIGRSNVGKSSLMNHLLMRKSLVKTSSTPGKTNQINYFLINDSFYFVDLPGYGFTKAPLEVNKSWRRMLEDFLKNCLFLQLILQLVDIRHPPSQKDIVFQKMLKVNQTPYVVVANKADKIKKGQIASQTKLIRQVLELDHSPLLHSATKKQGREEILEFIQQYVVSS